MRGRLAILVLKVLARLPLPINHALGHVVGWLTWRFAEKPRRITEINLARCLPGLSVEARRRIARRSLIETGKALTEAARLWQYGPRGHISKLRDDTGREHLEAAMDQGRGLIVLSPHLGSWEFAGLTMALKGPMTSLYRPPRLTAIDGLMRRGRASTGAELVPTDASGVRALMQALRAGGIVGILPDQEPGAGTGVFAPFFGIPAYTMTLVSRLAGKRNVPVIIAVAERLPRGRGYRMHYRPVPAEVADRDTAYATTVLNAAVEAIVRELPEQYLWSYERFGKRPEGEPRFYE